MAWAAGYPDGDALPVEVLVATVRAIARVTRVPLSVDIEGGYSSEPGAVVEVVAAVVDAGAVGINLEDGLAPPERLAQKMRTPSAPRLARASPPSSIPVLMSI